MCVCEREREKERELEIRSFCVREKVCVCELEGNVCEGRELCVCV